MIILARCCITCCQLAGCGNGRPTWVMRESSSRSSRITSILESILKHFTKQIKIWSILNLPRAIFMKLNSLQSKPIPLWLSSNLSYSRIHTTFSFRRRYSRCLQINTRISMPYQEDRMCSKEETNKLKSITNK